MTTDRNLNVALHSLLGVAEVCETGCTHLVAGEWTALGLANVAGRTGPHLSSAKYHLRRALESLEGTTDSEGDADA